MSNKLVNDVLDMLTDNEFFLFLGPFEASYLTTTLSNSEICMYQKFCRQCCYEKNKDINDYFENFHG